MGRPKKEVVVPKGELHEDHREYDEALVVVHRTVKTNKGFTESVEIRKVLRKGVRIDEDTAAALNASQDHQNRTSEGVPIIRWYFPSEMAIVNGNSYKAKDIISDEKFDDKGNPVVQGLHIYNETI